MWCGVVWLGCDVALGVLCYARAGIGKLVCSGPMFWEVKLLLDLVYCRREVVGVTTMRVGLVLVVGAYMSFDLHHY